MTRTSQQSDIKWGDQSYPENSYGGSNILDFPQQNQQASPQPRYPNTPITKKITSINVQKTNKCVINNYNFYGPGPKQLIKQSRLKSTNDKNSTLPRNPKSQKEYSSRGSQMNNSSFNYHNDSDTDNEDCHSLLNHLNNQNTMNNRNKVQTDKKEVEKEGRQFERQFEDIRLEDQEREMMKKICQNRQTKSKNQSVINPSNSNKQTPYFDEKQDSQKTREFSQYDTQQGKTCIGKDRTVVIFSKKGLGSAIKKSVKQLSKTKNIFKENCQKVIKGIQKTSAKISFRSKIISNYHMS